MELAALIRACTLESDTLIAHITKSNILEELHDRAELDFVAEGIMEKAAVSSVTRRLVQVMDWGSMADMIDDDAWGNEARFQEIIDQVFQSNDFPSPPEAVFNLSQTVSDEFNTESAAQSFVDNASPHGRFLSLLFTSMASLQTPSAMSALWIEFVSALRLRWEQKERVNNLRHVPGIDDMIPCGSMRTQKKKRHFPNALGSRAKNAAFVNSTEPEPNLNECLINQKLQVFNIGVETMIAMEMKELQQAEMRQEMELATQSIEEVHDSIKKEVKFTNIPDSNDDDYGGEIMNVDSQSCEFQSCGTSEDYQDAFEDDAPSPPRSDHAILKEHILLQGNFANGEAQANRRKGARCPVQGHSLIASGDQLYAPYLQREMPLTHDLVLSRREMLAETGTSTIQNRFEIAHRLQKPKLLNDMSAFKAANPGAVFQDFTNWYGNPENPLQMYDTNEIFNPTEFLAFSKNKTPEEEMAEAIFVLNATRTFWPETWDEAEPVPATDQKPLFDAFSTVEMLLQSLESMHPSTLLNQILAVNLSIANFVLKSSAPSCRIKIIDEALDRMERNISNAVSLLNKDVADNSKISKEEIGRNNPFKFISSPTITACEKACTCIGDAEILLSRATSLLSKFSGDVDIVDKLLKQNTENRTFEAQSVTSRQGILSSIYSQQQRNSGGTIEGMDELPSPSVREYILHNRDEKSPCQLTVCIGGTHGLEQGGTNSTKGGLVLAMNKCVKGIQ